MIKIVIDRVKFDEKNRKSIYHFVKLSLHERSDECEDFVHEPDRVHYMNGLQPDRHSFLKILEEPAYTTYRQLGQVTESHALHIEEEHISRRATLRVEARVDGHQQ